MKSIINKSYPEGFIGFVFGRQEPYVRKLMPLFIICLTLFSFSLIMGFYLGDSIPGDIIIEFIGTLPDLEDFNITTIFLFIFFNNVFKSFLWMVLGVLGSAPPLFFTVINGFFLGWFSYSTSLDYSLSFTILGLLPHGVIEVPAILLSSAAGMSIGYQVINRLRGRGNIRTEFNMAIRLFISRIIPLLLIAAVIEITLTPMVLALFGFI